MQPVKVRDWQVREGMLVEFHNIPGLWAVAHIADVDARGYVSRVYMEPRNRAASRYICTHTCGMLSVSTDAIPELQPQPLTGGLQHGRAQENRRDQAEQRRARRARYQRIRESVANYRSGIHTGSDAEAVAPA